MVQILVILLFLSLHLHEMLRANLLGLSHAEATAATLVPMALLWLGVTGSCIAAGRNIDRSGSMQNVRFAEQSLLIGMFLAAAINVVGIAWFGWLEAVRGVVGDLIVIDELLAIFPTGCFMIGAWWAIEPIERRLKEATLLRELQSGAPIWAPPSRVDYVIDQFRHHVLLVLIPLLLVAIWQEGILRVPAWAERFDFVLPHWWSTSAELLQWGGVLGVLLIAPVVLKTVWNTVPLAEGPVYDRAMAVCNSHNVRVTGPLVWQTRGGVVNAAILGIVWPFRYLLLSDGLLERLTAPQVEGVLAHEVAHVRKGHMLRLALWVVACVLVCGWLTFWSSHAMGFGESPSIAFEIASSLLTLAFVATIFGFVSRRYEWQADAFAASHLSGDSPTVSIAAAETMVETLESVASHNGVQRHRFSWRHGSIATRQELIWKLVGSPRGKMPIDRVCWWLNLASILLIAASLAPLLFDWIAVSLATSGKSL